MQDDVAPVLIFGGTRGTGKTTTARVLAAALNCPNQKMGEPCGDCPSCLGVWKTNSSSVLEIDAASNNGVEDVRNIQDIVLYAHQGSWRVVLMDEAHMMSREAFNAFLKTLEEPPPRTVFVLLTTEVDKIPETIKSRAMRFEFRRITTKDIVGRLVHICHEEGITASNEMLTEIARYAHGGLRDAVMTLDQAQRVGITDAEAFREHFGALENGPAIVRAAMAGNTVKATELASEAISRSGDTLALIQELQETIRDMIVLKAGGTPPLLEHLIPERKDLAQGCEAGALPVALRLLWTAEARVRGEDDQLTAAHVVVLLLCDVFCPVPRAKTPITPVEVERPATFDEMQALVQETYGGG